MAQLSQFEAGQPPLRRMEPVRSNVASFPAVAEVTELSVVIPLFNEVDNLTDLWERTRAALAEISGRTELILVNDGSTDGSEAALHQLQLLDPELRVVHLAVRRGQSAALAAGFRAARGCWIATLDGDLQNPPEEIPKLHRAGESCDLVFGRRCKRQDPLTKRIASRVGNSVRNWITGHRVLDSGCGLKLMRADALEHIPFFDGMHRFLPTLFASHGYTIRELAVQHAPRQAGKSKYGIVKRGVVGLIDCVAVRWLIRRSLNEIGAAKRSS